MKRFEIGNKYNSICWFTGGISEYTVANRTDSTVTLKPFRIELDGNHDCESETYDLHTDENGNEYIVLYSYHGHENRICA